MIRFEALQPYAVIRGLLPDSLVTITNIQWLGSEALELTCKASAGKVANELLYHLRQPFRCEPDFGLTNLNYDVADLFGRAGESS